ncbi:hypothetical protein LIER_19297 [Lithospermum erythrorhizon]|uniref:Disease resistance R13L4/SHOC-2-like LRR domain-containing protein n=1 Tax=Lithospermum erythrorhizon TaxID=34254 RepID=A0AAV3QIQ5_LITER
MAILNSNQDGMFFKSLLFQCMLVHFFFLNVLSETHWEDIKVLKQFKDSIDPDSIRNASCLSTWDFSLDPCDNLYGEKFTCGLRCDVIQGSVNRVTEVSLEEASYKGLLNSVNWNLPYLETLDFTGNYFYGSVPDSFGNLTRLKKLRVSSNSISGSVPDSIGFLSSLEELYLDNNFLEGTLPLALNGLENIKRLELQGNKFSGLFPDLSQLIHLDYLHASDNAFSGQLSEHFPPSLIEFSMRNNTFRGEIPSGVIELANLQVLDLSHNQLSGSVPASLFTHLALQQLTLSDNKFGSIQDPDTSSLVLNSQLIALDLSNNEISGFLPGFMGLMPQLSALSLENNRFSGFIPTLYATRVFFPGQGLARFERLLLGGNYIYGAIPRTWLNLEAGSVTVRLGDNCFYRCPLRYFLCEGGVQKSFNECQAFSSIIP